MPSLQYSPSAIGGGGYHSAAAAVSDDGSAVAPQVGEGGVVLVGGDRHDAGSQGTVVSEREGDGGQCLERRAAGVKNKAELTVPEHNCKDSSHPNGGYLGGAGVGWGGVGGDGGDGGNILRSAAHAALFRLKPVQLVACTHKHGVALYL